MDAAEPVAALDVSVLDSSEPSLVLEEAPDDGVSSALKVFVEVLESEDCAMLVQEVFGGP